MLLIRLVVGPVFLSEGVQKFLFAESLGVGRFARIGIPAPHVLAPFVASVEIVGGALVVLGFATRAAAAALAFDIAVALLSTKVPILLERGFWAAAHEARTDWAMLLGSVFLLVVGAGPWSVDARHRSSPGAS